MSPLGRDAFRKMATREELNASPLPAPEVLGTIADHITTPGPKGESATWQNADGSTVSVSDPPPPWELEDKAFEASDARRFVIVPDDWVLHWKSPRYIDANGWEYWQQVSSNDQRVTVKVESMIAPDGTIRRNGVGGDVLCWMHKSWVEKRRRQLMEETQRRTESAVNRQETLRDEFRRGTYGPYARLENAKHPTHTMAEGRSMQDA